MAEAGRRARSAPTRACSRSRPTRSTPRCPRPASGVVTEILVQEGETVEVGTVLAVIAPEGAEARAAVGGRRRARAGDRAGRGRGERRERLAGDDARPPRRSRRRSPHRPTASETHERADGRPTASGNGKSFVSPVVARIAAEHGVDPGQVQGTGRGGRVTKKDILAFIESAGTAQAAPAGAGSPGRLRPAPAARAPPPPRRLPPPARACCRLRRRPRLRPASSSSR